MTWRAAIVPAWLLALAAGGCGGGSPSSLSVAQACSDLAMARCNLRSACSLPQGTTGVGASVLEAYGDMQTCLAREALACSNALAAPQTGDSPQSVEACVRKLSSYSCADFFDYLPPTDCLRLGARADGAPCTFDAQCESGVCAGIRIAVCGTCGEPPHDAEDCSATACVRGDRCLPATSTCGPIVPFDGLCDENQTCEVGLSCIGADPSAMTAGTCRVAVTRAGEACGGARPGCEATRGLWCAGAGDDADCAVMSIGGPSCGQLADGSRAGCVAGGCYTESGPAIGAALGSCKPFAPDGYGCDTALGPGCMAPARCVTYPGSTVGICVIPDASLCPAG
jgi:hypothetical protein